MSSLDAKALTPRVLAGMIDHSFLKPFGSPADIEGLCREALEYEFAMVAVHPAEISACAALLRGSRVHIGATVGFPLGQNSRETKAYETEDALKKGAHEIDMVINVRALQAGNLELVREEISDTARICRTAGAVSKVILETCYLTDEQKRQVCVIASEEGVDFVKTSTGFGPQGATVEDVALMHQAVAGLAGVKAAGGIKTLEFVRALIQAGAARLGTSSSVAIMKELQAELGAA